MSRLTRALFHTLVLAVSCGCFLAGSGLPTPTPPGAITPVVVTERVKHDTDDPAIWLNAADPTRSLIIGTDKDEDGALYAFGLDGRIVKVTPTLKRPNNVDVEYGLSLGGTAVDIAVATERLANRIRVFRVPDLAPIDCGGIDVFVGEAERAPMGVAVYKRPSDGAVFAVVGRKSGPTNGGYIWQYRLEDDGKGCVKGTKVRAFGVWSGTGEIEAIAVDDSLGYVYYSDEAFGVRKYRADPDGADVNRELAVFGTNGFTGDREGISIYTATDTTGYVVVSDQEVGKFHVFPREGSQGNPHAHPLLKIVQTKTNDSDGSDVTSATLGDVFPKGLFVAMSQDGTFQLYCWADLAGADLTVAPTSIPIARAR